jgi:hypothetical protein
LPERVCCLECQAVGIAAVGDRAWAAQHQRDTGHQRFAGVAPRTFTASFRLRSLVPLNRELLNLALMTIAMVWDRRVGKPQEFLVSVADKIQTGNADDQPSGIYLHNDRHFAFAKSTMFGKHQGNVQKAFIVKTSAHEAMHAVQCARGDHLIPISGNSPAYATAPSEIEANEEAVLVLKGFLPELSGAVPLGGGGRLYDVPATSPYTAIWEELEQRGVDLRCKLDKDPPAS